LGREHLSPGSGRSISQSIMASSAQTVDIADVFRVEDPVRLALFTRLAVLLLELRDFLTQFEASGTCTGLSSHAVKSFSLQLADGSGDTSAFLDAMHYYMRGSRRGNLIKHRKWLREHVSALRESRRQYTLACVRAGTPVADSPFSGRLVVAAPVVLDCAYMAQTSICTVDATGVARVGAHAFLDCTGIAGVVQMPGHSIRGLVIGRAALKGCTGVTEVRLGCVYQLPSEVFAGCARLTTVTVPWQARHVGPRACADCVKLKTITFAVPDPSDAMTSAWKPGNRLEAVGGSAFRNCAALTEVALPENVVKIGPWAFKGCSRLARLVLPPGLAAISTGLAEHCRSLKAVQLPVNLEKIYSQAFWGCALECVVLPFGVTHVGADAFGNNRQLKTISVAPAARVTGLAFRLCRQLTVAFVAPGVTKETVLTDTPAKLWSHPRWWQPRAHGIGKELQHNATTRTAVETFVFVATRLWTSKRLPHLPVEIVELVLSHLPWCLYEQNAVRDGGGHDRRLDGDHGSSTAGAAARAR